MDEILAQFTSITSADPERSAQYLKVTDHNLEQAIQLFFENDGAALEGTGSAIAQSTSSNHLAGTTPADAIDVDDDAAASQIPAISNPDQSFGVQGRHAIENDEEMARRLQEEMYGSAAGGMGQDREGIRAPIGRTTDTLLGPDPGFAGFADDPDELQAAVRQQMLARARRGVAPNRRGIFNQQPTSSSIWEGDNADEETRRRDLSRVTGGASDASSKSSMLAEMFRPPFELISSHRTWDGVRAAGKEEEKWILINIQDPNIFDCQVLNRDIWKDAQIHATVKEHFIFKQYTKSDPQAENYIRYYFQAHESEEAYPHIAIVDPRTGEQVKVWSGSPAPKAMDFLMQLHEFLDRYSLKAFAKNPVAKRKSEVKKEKAVEKMSEEEMLQMAMQNSLRGGAGPKDDDPDDLTRSVDLNNKGKGIARDVVMAEDDSEEHSSEQSSLFAQISSTKPHDEPATDAPNTTRIQFRHPGGRVVHRFSLADPVSRLYEWLKASPLDEKQGVAFELIFMKRNMIETLEQSIGDAGLKNGSVMVEFT